MNYHTFTRKCNSRNLARILFQYNIPFQNCISAIFLYNGKQEREVLCVWLYPDRGFLICAMAIISQKQLAEKICLSASPLSRIVSGETKTVSSDILIGVAKEFKVSANYILVQPTLSVRKSYDVSELGVSDESARRLATGTIDVQILNCLLEHRNFPKMMNLIRIFQDMAAKGIMARDQMIERATASMSNLMKEYLEHRAETRQDMQFMNAQKMANTKQRLTNSRMYFLLFFGILSKIRTTENSREKI